MMRLRDSLVRPFGAGLAVWMLAVGATVPLLDRDLGGSHVAIEAEHQATCTLAVHDHTLCSHFGKLTWPVRPVTGHRASSPVVAEKEAQAPGAVPTPLRSRPTQPRAPPRP